VPVRNVILMASRASLKDLVGGRFPAPNPPMPWAGIRLGNRSPGNCGRKTKPCRDETKPCGHNTKPCRRNPPQCRPRTKPCRDKTQPCGGKTKLCGRRTKSCRRETKSCGRSRRSENIILMASRASRMDLGGRAKTGHGFRPNGP
jgi:hypothetical protein